MKYVHTILSIFIALALEVIVAQDDGKRKSDDLKFEYQLSDNSYARFHFPSMPSRGKSYQHHLSGSTERTPAISSTRQQRSKSVLSQHVGKPSRTIIKRKRRIQPQPNRQGIFHSALSNEADTSDFAEFLNIQEGAEHVHNTGFGPGAGHQFQFQKKRNIGRGKGLRQHAIQTGTGYDVQQNAQFDLGEEYQQGLPNTGYSPGHNGHFTSGKGHQQQGLLGVSYVPGQNFQSHGNQGYEQDISYDPGQNFQSHGNIGYQQEVPGGGYEPNSQFLGAKGLQQYGTGTGYGPSFQSGHETGTGTGTEYQDEVIDTGIGIGAGFHNNAGKPHNGHQTAYFHGDDQNYMYFSSNPNHNQGPLGHNQGAAQLGHQNQAMPYNGYGFANEQIHNNFIQSQNDHDIYGGGIKPNHAQEIYNDDDHTDKHNEYIDDSGVTGNSNYNQGTGFGGGGNSFIKSTTFGFHKLPKHHQSDLQKNPYAGYGSTGPFQAQGHLKDEDTSLDYGGQDYYDTDHQTVESDDGTKPSISQFSNFNTHNNNFKTEPYNVPNSFQSKFTGSTGFSENIRNFKPNSQIPGHYSNNDEHEYSETTGISDDEDDDEYGPTELTGPEGYQQTHSGYAGTSQGNGAHFQRGRFNSYPLSTTGNAGFKGINQHNFNLGQTQPLNIEHEAQNFFSDDSLGQFTSPFDRNNENFNPGEDFDGMTGGKKVIEFMNRAISDGLKQFQIDDEQVENLGSSQPVLEDYRASNPGQGGFELDHETVEVGPNSYNVNYQNDQAVFQNIENEAVTSGPAGFLRKRDKRRLNQNYGSNNLPETSGIRQQNNAGFKPKFKPSLKLQSMIESNGQKTTHKDPNEVLHEIEAPKLLKNEPEDVYLDIDDDEFENIDYLDDAYDYYDDLERKGKFSKSTADERIGTFQADRKGRNMMMSLEKAPKDNIIFETIEEIREALSVNEKATAQSILGVLDEEIMDDVKKMIVEDKSTACPKDDWIKDKFPMCLEYLPKCHQSLLKDSSENEKPGLRVGAKNRELSSFASCLINRYPALRNLSEHRSAPKANDKESQKYLQKLKFRNNDECTRFVHVFFRHCRIFIPSCSLVKLDQEVALPVLGCLVLRYPDLMKSVMETKA